MWGVFPELDQVEIHPLFTQIPLRNYCKENGIQVEAYSSTARHDDRLFNPPLIRNIAKTYKKHQRRLFSDSIFKMELYL